MDGTRKAIDYPFDSAPGPGEAIELAEGVLWLRLPLPMALDHVNVYALDDGNAWTLIDTGLDTAKSRELWEAILGGPLAGKAVGRVIVTHHHPDHIGLAGWFQARGAELWTTRTSWLMARMLLLDEHERPPAELLDFWRAAGMDAELLARRASERPFNFADVVAHLPLGYRRIEEGQALTVGGRDWLVRMGNGHAPEHATLWSSDGAVILGGDQFLPMISANLGVYASEPDADPVAEWIASCETMLPHASGFETVLPGHKLPFSGLPTRLGQMIENHTSALERLLRHLETPRTAVECFAPLFKRRIGDAEFGLAMVEAVAHLNHLLRAERVSRTRRPDGAWVWRLTRA